jgi:hypothetical protein
MVARKQAARQDGASRRRAASAIDQAGLFPDVELATSPLFLRQPSQPILGEPAQAGYGDKWPS